MKVDFWFDFSCPYAYLAWQRVEALVRPPHQISLRPMLLGGVFRATGAGEGPLATSIPAKLLHTGRDMMRWAEHLGVPLDVPARHPMRTVRALRVLLGLAETRWPSVVHALYDAYWRRGDDVTQDEVIRAALDGAGVPAGEADAAFAGANSDAVKLELRRRTDLAVSLGIFGAPAMVIHREGGGEPILLWGQDRLHWLEAVLAGWDPDRDRPPTSVPTGWPTQPAEIPARLDFWFDLSSPFAYLGSTQIEAVARSTGALLTWRPFLLGALFKNLGTPNVPLLAAPDAKRRYLARELDRWSRFWGVPFRFPRRFPMRTVLPLRLLIAAGDALPRLAQRLFAAAWAEDRDISDPAELAALCREVEVDPTLLTTAETTPIKEALFAATAEATRLGIFGVPTCIVDHGGGPLLFWGQDRLELVAKAAAGWRPRTG
jgi:2-hydroxychromene-2-carboxylate isomerase